MRGEAAAARRSAIGWAVLAAGGLIIAVAGMITPVGTERDATPGVRLGVSLPDAVILAVIVAFAAAALLLLGLLWPRELRRRRKKADDEFEPVHEPPETPWWVWVVFAALVLASLAGIAAIVWTGGPQTALVGRGVPAVRERLPAPGDSTHAETSAPVAEKRTVSLTPFNVAVAVLASVAAVVVLGMMLWLYFGDRLTRWWVGPVFDEAARPLREAVAASLDDLRAEPDARRAIIGCYRRFEHALAASRLPRAPWQTSSEFMHAVLRRLALPGDAIRLLTGLFELARFSDRPVGTTERDVACDCLAEIRAALEARDEHAAPA